MGQDRQRHIFKGDSRPVAVSYTHLDVYKRQGRRSSPESKARIIPDPRTLLTENG